MVEVERDAAIHSSTLEADPRLQHAAGNGRPAWLQAADADVSVAGHPLEEEATIRAVSSEF